MRKPRIDEFLHSDLSCNLELILISRWVGLNSLRTSQVVRDLVALDYHLPSLGLTADLYLVQGLNMLITFFLALSSNPRSLTSIWLMSATKLKVKSNLTLKTCNSICHEVAQRWSRLGPWLGESSHLRVHLELEGMLKRACHLASRVREPLGECLKIKGGSQGADLTKRKVWKVFHLNGAKFACECLKKPSIDESLFQEDLLLT